MKNRYISFLGLLLTFLLMVSTEAQAQCTTTSCDVDDVFVGNFGGLSDLVRFSKADIAINGNAATSVIIASGFGFAEGLANDFDGTVIVTTRFTGNVERVCRDGSQRAIEANVNLAEGPSFAPNGDLFLNNTGPTCVTLRAAPAVPFGGLIFVNWVTSHPPGTFCEDTRIAPITSPVFPGELFIMRSTPGLTFNPNAIDAFSASVAETPLGAVIPDFGTAAALALGSYTSLGMAFDSQGDIWITKWTGPVGSELLEFSASTNYGFSRAVSITRPGNVTIGNNALVKICISPPDPNDPLNPGNDTLFVADFGGFLHVVDEVSGATLASPNDNLVTPAGVACCDVIVAGEPDERRMTGGGSVFQQGTGQRFTHGFELHCDPSSGPNNLEINWGGNRFHMTSLDSATCSDDPNLDEGNPVAGFDTFEGSGTGRLNGVPGAMITFKFTDDGEPGKNADLAEFTIDDGGPLIVVSGFLNRGNHQAHRK